MENIGIVPEHDSNSSPEQHSPYKIWVNLVEEIPLDINPVAARTPYGEAYKYSSILIEGRRVFIGDETMYLLGDPELKKWEWLKED